MRSREQQVLKLISEGYTTREISNQLFISSETVKTYRAQLLTKLNARNAAHLVYVAIQCGYLA